MKYENGTPYSDEQWKRWYGMKSSDEIDPEAQQEYIEAQIDQMREDGYHSHGRR
jgi:hypothetical protein